MTVTAPEVHRYQALLSDDPEPDVWQEVNCHCRNDGPWTVYGPEVARYHCARCGHILDRRAL